jgi:hypothetical protein
MQNIQSRIFTQDNHIKSCIFSTNLEIQNFQKDLEIHRLKVELGIANYFKNYYKKAYHEFIQSEVLNDLKELT